MLKTIFRGTGALCAGILPFDLDGADKVSKSSKTGANNLFFILFLRFRLIWLHLHDGFSIITRKL